MSISHLKKEKEIQYSVSIWFDAIEWTRTDRKMEKNVLDQKYGGACIHDAQFLLVKS